MISHLSYKQTHPIAVWVLFSANMMIVVWSTQWLTTVESSYHVNSITPLLKRSVWASNLESMLSVFISLDDPLQFRLTIGPWSGLTASKKIMPD